MPVYKYRRIEDMPSERWLRPGDPHIVRGLRGITRMAVALAGPLPIPRGVHKYRSFDDLQNDRERWEQQRIDRLRK